MIRGILLRRSLRGLTTQELAIWAQSMQYGKLISQLAVLQKEHEDYMSHNESQAIHSEFDKVRFGVLRWFLLLILVFDVPVAYKTYKTFIEGVPTPEFITIVLIVLGFILLEWSMGVMKIKIKNETEFDTQKVIELKQKLMIFFCFILCAAMPISTLTEMLGEINNINLMLDTDSSMSEASMRSKKIGVWIRYLSLAFASFVIHIVCFLYAHKLLTAFTVKRVVKGDKRFKERSKELEEKKFLLQNDLIQSVIVYESKVRAIAHRFGLDPMSIRGKFSPMVEILFTEATHQNKQHGKTP